jgi:hypothetical protein
MPSCNVTIGCDGWDVHKAKGVTRDVMGGMAMATRNRVGQSVASGASIQSVGEKHVGCMMRNDVEAVGRVHHRRCRGWGVSDEATGVEKGVSKTRTAQDKRSAWCGRHGRQRTHPHASVKASNRAVRRAQAGCVKREAQGMYVEVCSPDGHV